MEVLKEEIDKLKACLEERESQIRFLIEKSESQESQKKNLKALTEELKTGPGGGER